jgi:glyoxylase-like metal-dependent hydrolase (beta-lactamase superfamily II)
MGTFALGDITIGRVAEIELPAFPALEFLPAATPAMLEEARRAMPARFSTDDKLIMSFHSFVLRAGRHTIVVDTCCGKSRPGREQFDTGRKDWLAGLNALGVKPEEVTHVMCTHLHWDHVGWNTRRVDGQWAPTFTNAKYIMAKREYDHWDAVYAKEGTKGGNIHAMAFEDSVLPIMRAERAVLVKDDFELDRGISFEPCAGHSPGHVVLNLESNGKHGVVIGDVVHHPMQLMFPELSTRADFDMNASRVTRRALIEKHAGTGNLVMPHHFAAPSCGTFERAGAGFRFEAMAGS